MRGSKVTSRYGLSLSGPIALLLAYAQGCGDNMVPDFPADMPAVWVDPARCLLSCTHEVETGLVTVDESANVSPDGMFQLQAEAQPALAALIRSAASDSYTITIGSAHRTYTEQAMLWDTITEIGRVARPGHSEHEAGLAVDLGFGTAGADVWTADNAWRFGFVLSYPQHKQKTTGFRYEAWHFRFIGSAVAFELHGLAGVTLEELFASTPGLGIYGDCHDCPLDSSRSVCGALTPSGLCEGTVLSWCFDGAIGGVDCATSGLVCQSADSTIGVSSDCVDP